MAKFNRGKIDELNLTQFRSLIEVRQEGRIDTPETFRGYYRGVNSLNLQLAFVDENGTVDSTGTLLLEYVTDIKEIEVYKGSLPPLSPFNSRFSCGL